MHRLMNLSVNQVIMKLALVNMISANYWMYRLVCHLSLLNGIGTCSKANKLTYA